MDNNEFLPDWWLTLIGVPGRWRERDDDADPKAREKLGLKVAAPRQPLAGRSG